jgi:hypothetical protein
MMLWGLSYLYGAKVIHDKASEGKLTMADVWAGKMPDDDDRKPPFPGGRRS